MRSEWVQPSLSASVTVEGHSLLHFSGLFPTEIRPFILFISEFVSANVDLTEGWVYWMDDFRFTLFHLQLWCFTCLSSLYETLHLSFITGNVPLAYCDLLRGEVLQTLAKRLRCPVKSLWLGLLISLLSTGLQKKSSFVCWSFQFGVKVTKVEVQM